MTYAKCPDCGKTVICGQCKSDIAEAKWAVEMDRHYGLFSRLMGYDRDLFPPPALKGKNWLGKDGSVL